MNTKAPPDTTGGAHLTPLMLTGNDAFMLTPNVAQQSGRPGSVFACLRVGWSRGQVWCGDAAPLCGRRAVAAWYLLAG